MFRVQGAGNLTKTAVLANARKGGEGKAYQRRGVMVSRSMDKERSSSLDDNKMTV